MSTNGPRHIVKNVTVNDPGRDGFHFDAEAESVEADGLEANRPGRDGVHFAGENAKAAEAPPARLSSRDPWYRRPLGIFGLAVAAGIVLELIRRYVF